MAALIEGRLTMSDGCLMVREFPVVWPHGATWDAEGQAVRLADGQLVGLGDRVSGGGGYLHVAVLATEVAAPLQDCPMNKYEEVATFNPGEQLTVTR